MTTYEPGTVVLARVGCDAAAPRMLFKSYGVEWFDLSGAEIEPGNVTDIRPLAVIDPQDDEQVRRLLTEYHEQFTTPWEPTEHQLSRFGAALTAYATPAPPPLPEPQEWGARVTDANGKSWLLSHPDLPEPWLGKTPGGHWLRSWWKDIPQPARLGWDEEADQ